MNNYNFSLLSNNESLPAWYRSEHYEYCDDMYTEIYKKVQFSLFNKVIKYFL